MAGGEPAGDVYAAYGAVMHLVQYWESALAMAWWRKEVLPRDNREAESKAAAKAVAKMESALIKITASQARRDLEGAMPPELLAAVGDLLPLRNRLAHRFLREQQDRDGFRTGTMKLLAEAGEAFDKSVVQMHEVLKESPYAGAVRAHWPALAEALTARLLSGVPIDYEQALKAFGQPHNGGSSDSESDQDPI